MTETVRKCDICNHKIFWRDRYHHVKYINGRVFRGLDICADCWDDMKEYINDKRDKGK